MPGVVRHEEQHSADAAEAVLEGGERQEGQLGPALQGEDSQQPPAPWRTIGTGLDTHTQIYSHYLILEKVHIHLCT